jgi:hypothetical protein
MITDVVCATTYLNCFANINRRIGSIFDFVHPPSLPHPNVRKPFSAYIISSEVKVRYIHMRPSLVLLDAGITVGADAAAAFVNSLG